MKSARSDIKRLTKPLNDLCFCTCSTAVHVSKYGLQVVKKCGFVMFPVGAYKAIKLLLSDPKHTENFHCCHCVRGPHWFKINIRHVVVETAILFTNSSVVICCHTCS